MRDISLGFSVLHPDTCWKAGQDDIQDLKDLVAVGSQKFGQMDGGALNKETLMLKQDQHCLYTEIM